LCRLVVSNRKLQVFGSAGETALLQAKSVSWDDEKMRLIIGKWREFAPRLALGITPLPKVPGGP
jgi:hypothetical protein